MNTQNTEDTKDPEVLQARLTMARAFIQMLLVAFDALKSHGVDYRQTPAYKDTRLMDEAEKLPVLRGMDRYLTWMAKVESDIFATIRRKALRVFKREDPKDG